MSYLRGAHERTAYAKVFYGDSGVYVNKLNIQNQELLEATERTLTAQRARQGFPPTAHHRDYHGFKEIHRHLFQDLYDWAGEERAYTTGRGAVPFAVPEHIEGWMVQQFAHLETEKYLVGTARAEFVPSAARYVNEINAGHPFIDGNGRTQRFWLRMLCDNAGYDLTLTEADQIRWNEASRMGFDHGEHGPMAKLIDERLTERDDGPGPQSGPAGRRPPQAPKL